MINKYFINNLKQSIFVFLKMLIYWVFSLFIKRDKNIWIISGGHGFRFTDNSKHFFVYLNKFSTKRVIWITKSIIIRDKLRETGYESYLFNEKQGIYFALKAKVHIVDIDENSLNPFTSMTALKLNLWHGILMKNVGEYEREFDQERSSLYNMKSKIYYTLKKYNLLFLFESIKPGFWLGNHIYFLATSETTQEVFTKALRIPKNNFFMANYPRNRILLQEDLNDRLFIDEEIPVKLKIEDLKKQNYSILGYFPTFRRDYDGEILFGLHDENEICRIVAFLEENKIALVFKTHAGSKKDKKSQIWKRDVDGKKFPNLIEIPKMSDLNPLLTLCDVLLTDYSGVTFDYLWLDRPIIFYPFKHQAYLKKRGLIHDYSEVTPGRIVNSIDELLQALTEYKNNKTDFTNEFEEKRKKVKKRFFLREESSKIIEKTFDLILK